MMINIVAGWAGFLLGIIAGAFSGLRFYSEDFMGGYSSWTRRLVRLAHIAFFGLGLINIAFALTVRSLGIESNLGLASVLLVIGAVTMPLVCYLSAFKPIYRHLFFIPVASVFLGVAITLWRILA